MQDFFLHVTNSWGLSDKPGQKEMWINNDGSYVLKLEFSRSKDMKDNSEKQGKIDESKITEIKAFLEKNITVDTNNNTMRDASYHIEWKNNDKTINVINNVDVWEKITALIPEYKLA